MVSLMKSQEYDACYHATKKENADPKYLSQARIPTSAGHAEILKNLRDRRPAGPRTPSNFQGLGAACLKLDPKFENLGEWFVRVDENMRQLFLVKLSFLVSKSSTCSYSSCRVCCQRQLRRGRVSNTSRHRFKLFLATAPGLRQSALTSFPHEQTRTSRRSSVPPSLLTALETKEERAI